MICICRYVPEMPVFNRYDAAYYEFMRIFDAFKVGTLNIAQCYILGGFDVDVIITKK